jgi:iron(III) transport system ATP-binding protein
MSGIRMSNLVKVFPTPAGAPVRALDGVSLEVADGELVVLLGPSGCGKTTLLRCLAGLEQPDSGEISIADEVVYSSERRTQVSPEHRNLGMVFQSYALWPHMTVQDNVAYPLRRRKQGSGSDARALVAESLARVDCEHLADRYPNELSGGQQQRVALARALVAKPRVLLFDEPLSNLDALLRERMRTGIKRVQRQLGHTAVYVTHDQREALALADRLVVMQHGNILQAGPPRAIYARPATAFVADFLGGANLIPVAGRAVDGRVETPVGRLGVIDPSGRDGRASQVAIRPELISVAEALEPRDAAKNHVSAVLEVAEFLGDQLQAEFTAGGITLRVRLPSWAELTTGESYTLQFAPEACLLVDADGAARQARIY